MIERNAFLSFLFVACLNGGDPTIVGEVFRLYEMVPPVSSEDRLAVAAKQSERLSEILVKMHNEAHVSTIDAVDAVFWELQLSLNLARVKQSLSVASKSVERCCDRLRVIHGSLDRIQESRQFDRLLLKVSLMHAMELGAEMRATRSIDCKFDEEIAALLDTLKSDFDKGLLT